MGSRMRKVFISYIALIVVLFSQIDYSIASGNREHVMSDSNGPQFLDIGDMFADHIPSNDPVNGTLHLTATVRDSDGIDTVIASFRNSSEISWSNLTMLFYSTVNEDTQIYSIDALEYTLDANHRNAQWDIKFYANDTLGNWNSSAQFIYSVWLPALVSNNLDAVVISIGLGVIILLAIIVTYFKRT